MDEAKKAVLARSCVQQPTDAAPGVRIAELWEWVFRRVEGSGTVEALIDHWAPAKVRETPELRRLYGVRHVAHEMLTRAARDEVFRLFVNDGERVWRLPTKTVAGGGKFLDLEMTWTLGRLWEFDVPDAYRDLARLDLPLITDEADAQKLRTTVARHIAEVAASSDHEWPAADPQQRDELAARLRTQKWYPVREALLWIAARNAAVVAEVMLTSAWSAADNRDGIAGSVWAACDIFAQGGHRSFVVRDPEPALISALANEEVGAIGIYEGRGPPQRIESYAWEHLEFAVPPAAQFDDSAARRRSQTIGISWSGHWTGLRFAREDIWRAFPPVETGSPATAQVVEDQSGPSGKVPPKANRSLGRWLSSDDVCAAASERVSERGGDPTDERAIRIELGKMLDELAWSRGEDSVAALRRRAGFTARDD